MTYAPELPPSFRIPVISIAKKCRALFSSATPSERWLVSTEIEELGDIETPILLTSTTSVPRVADALISYMLALPGNEDVLSINPVVGETNDGYLSDIRGRHITPEDVFAAIKNAQAGPVEEGAGVPALAPSHSVGREASEPPPVNCLQNSAAIRSEFSCRQIMVACSQLQALR